MLEPKLTHFDLDEAILDRARVARSKDESLSSWLSSASFAVGFCPGAAAGPLLQLLNPSKDWAPILLFYGGVIGGGLTGALVQWLFQQYLLQYIRCKVLPPEQTYKGVFERLEKYDAACRSYKQWKACEQQKQEEYWFGLGGHAFESELAAVLKRHGWKVAVTRGSGDKGIDIDATYGTVKYAIQCKAHKKAVGPAVVRDLLGAKTAGGYEKALLVSLAGVTSGALRFAQENQVDVWTVADVVSLARRS